MLITPETLPLLQPALNIGVQNIKLSVGDFLIDPIKILRPYTVLAGSGFGTQLRLKSGSDDHAISVTGDDCSLGSFQLDANKDGQSAARHLGLLFDNVRGGALDLLRVLNAKDDCIRISESSELAVSRTYVKGSGNIGMRIIASKLISVSDLQALSSRYFGLSVDGVSGRVTLSGVHAEANESHGIFIEEGSSFVTLSTSIARANGGGGIHLNQQLATAGILEQITVIGCVASENGAEGIAVIANQNGTHVRDILLADNIAMNNGRNTPWTKAGILIGRHRGGSAKIENVVVKGNRCGDNQETKTQEYGVVLQKGVEGIVAVDNNLRGNAIDGLRDDGAVFSLIEDNLE